MRRRPIGAGGPAADLTIAAIADQTIRDGFIEEGVGILLDEDCYLRESEWLGRVPTDFSFYQNSVSIEIADPAAGVTAKTKGRQGVIVESSALKAVLKEVVAITPAATPVFRSDSTRLRRVWHAALVKRRLEKAAGPVHTVRHSKPAADVMKGRRSLEGVRRRGRWDPLTRSPGTPRRTCC